MAGFSRNPNGDGEQWLPSDIFMTEPQHHHHHTAKHAALLNHLKTQNTNTNTHYFSSCMDDLTQSLSALTLLKQKQRTTSNPLQRFEPVQAPVRPVQCGQENPSCLCQACLGLGNNGFNKFPPKPDYYKLNRVDVFLESRARALRKQHHQQVKMNQNQNQNQNRVLQNRTRFGVGGLGKVSSGGTGVFHPRVARANYDNTPTSTNSSIAKKKQVMMTRHNKPEIFQASSQMNNSVTTNTRSPSFVGHCQIAPPEMGLPTLPKDWTY